MEMAQITWRRLPADPFKALLWMSRRAYDDGKTRGVHPPYHYWAGPRGIAFAIGATDSEDEPLTRAQENRVRRAVHALLDCGAVTLIERGSGRVASVYRINVKPDELLSTPVDRDLSESVDNETPDPACT